MTFRKSTLAGLLLTATIALPAVAAEQGPQLVMPGTVSAVENEYNYNLSADGRVLVFARSQANFAGSKILIAELRDGRWSAPELIGFSDARYKDSDPWLTADGRTIYFVSNRPTPSRPDKKDLDIWRTVRQGDGWAEPEHLGDTVNSPQQELGPELHGDTLYFNSNRPGGPGTLDIHAAKLKDGVFGAATPLPAPVNSPEQEGDFTLSPDGGMALFWSLRDGKGKLYRVARQGDGWGPAVALPDDVNGGGFQFTPQFSADGKTLYFASVREREGNPAGMADIYSIPVDRLGK